MKNRLKYLSAMLFLGATVLLWTSCCNSCCESECCDPGVNHDQKTYDSTKAY